MRGRPGAFPLLITALGVLAGIGPLSTDLILPTFTGIATELAAEPSAVQLTLTGFLVGIGCGPLIVGPLSDRHGRRPVLVIALVTYALAALAITFAGSIVFLVLARVAQGFGASAGVVLARSIAADVTHGRETVRAISVISVGVGVAALLAPILGGALQTLWGWRAAFVFLTLLGAAMLVMVVTIVPETHPPAERTTGAGPLALLQGIGALIRRGDVRGYVVAIGAGYAALMGFLVASPFVGQVVLGLDPFTYGWLLTIIATSMPVVSFVNAALARRVEAHRMLAVAQVLIVTAACALLVLALTDTLTVVTFTVCGFVLGSGAGLTMANTVALALGVAGSARGAASALCSAGQYATGATAPLIVGALGTGSALPMAITVGIFAVIGVVAVVLARIGEPPSGVAGTSGP